MLYVAAQWHITLTRYSSISAIPTSASKYTQVHVAFQYRLPRRLYGKELDVPFQDKVTAVSVYVELQLVSKRLILWHCFHLPSDMQS